MSAERVGIFGGTFDPPHVGHLVTAVNVRHALSLDRLLMVVAGEPWQKMGLRRVSPAADRLAMVEAAVAGVEGIEASALEVDRPGPSYTADTLAELHRRHRAAELFLILGGDAAAGLETWAHPERLAPLARLVVVDRPGEAAAVPDGLEAIRVEVPRLEVSSSDLRARAADGRPLDYLVPAAVVTWLRQRRLYR